MSRQVRPSRDRPGKPPLLAKLPLTLEEAVSYPETSPLFEVTLLGTSPVPAKAPQAPTPEKTPKAPIPAVLQ